MTVSEARSRTMRAVRSINTAPELRLRRALHAAGTRYRLHAPDLPGKPDIVFRRARVAVFVHGCFWHRHPGCKRASTPATRLDYWLPKFERNVARDQLQREALESTGWKVVTLWECELRSPAHLLAAVDAIRGCTRR